jgi:coenzyme F420 hydrogenase subunit beta
LYTSSYSGYAIDYETRYHGASGGLLTAFVAFLLDKKYISAVVVAENDLSQQFLNKTILIHSSKELHKARSSKYCPVKFDSIIRQVKEETGYVVIVGLPCIIHGYRKYEQKDQKFREKVFGYFGLYCSCGRTFNLTEYVFKKNNIDKSRLSYFQYRDDGCLGSMIVRQYRDCYNSSDIALLKEDIIYKRQFQNYYLPLRSIFIPNRCLFCIDHYAELADVSFGDVQYGKYREDKIGVNSIVVRNNKFNTLLHDAKLNNYIHIESLPENELVCCQASAPKKKGRVGGVIRFAKAIGKVVPEYDMILTKYVYWKSIAYYLFAKSQMFIGKRKRLWWLVPIIEKRIHDGERQ